MQLEAIQSAAHTLDEQIKIYNLSNEVELENAFANFREDDIEGFILVADPFFVNRRDQIISSAARGRIAGVYFLREFLLNPVGSRATAVISRKLIVKRVFTPVKYSAGPSRITCQ